MVNILEKIVTVPRKVEDLTGLLIDLKRASFGVRNVGADHHGTFVYLDLQEDKDPVPIVESWVGRKPPSMTDQAAFQARLADLKAVMNQAPAVSAAAGAPADDPSVPAPAPAAPPAAAAAPKRFAFIRRILGLK
jgi:hypothetical protein